MTWLKIVFVIGVVGTLSACTGMTSSFDCGKVGGQGVGCSSMEQVNQMANEGKFSQRDGVETGDDTGQMAIGKLTGFQGATPKSGMPLRFGESVQNMWVAPYTDTGNNYHWAQMVTMIIAPGHWVGAPVSSIKASGEN